MGFAQQRTGETLTRIDNILDHSESYPTPLQCQGSKGDILIIRVESNEGVEVRENEEIEGVQSAPALDALANHDSAWRFSHAKERNREILCSK